MKVSVLTPALSETSFMKSNRELLGDYVVEFLVDDSKPLPVARNNLLKRAKGDYVLWLDSDVELTRNIIPELKKHLNDGVIGVSASTRTMPTDWKNSLKLLDESVFRGFAPSIVNNPRSCMFECSLFKKKPLISVGGFNDSFVSGEDNDLCERLLSGGYRLVKLNSLLVNHYYDSSNIGRKMRWYGAGERLLEKRYGKYDYAEFDLPSRSDRWFARLKEAVRLGKVYLLPLLIPFNLYCRLNWRKGYESVK